MSPINSKDGRNDVLGGMVRSADKNKVVILTAGGNIKVSNITEYKMNKCGEKLCKVKDGDKMVFAAFCNDNDYVIIFNGENILKLAVNSLPVAGKLTVGTKSGFDKIVCAALGTDKDNLLFVTKDFKGKLTPVKDFNVDSRGNKGQSIAENTWIMCRFDDSRENIYLIPKQGKGFAVPRSKVSIKGRTAVGAALTNRQITQVR